MPALNRRQLFKIIAAILVNIFAAQNEEPPPPTCAGRL
jgi:hypothetical protein